MCAVAGFAVGSLLWPLIALPFSNPLEAVGPLTVLRFSPSTNILRYLVFVLAPSIVFALTWRSPAIRAYYESEDAKTADVSKSTSALEDAAVIGTWVLLALFVAGSLLTFLGSPLSMKPIDLFHEGEFLTPALEFLRSGALWSKSYFVHGAFNDPLATVLGWKWFGVVSIGASRIVRMALGACLPLCASLLFLTALEPLRAAGRKTAWALGINVFLAMWALVCRWYFPFVPFWDRELPALVGLASLVGGIGLRSCPLLFLSGVISAAGFFYSIDRGCYFTAVFLVSIGAASVAEHRRWKSIVLPALAGFAAGWTAFIALVGWHEFAAFLRATVLALRVKDSYDAYVYPAPSLMSPFGPHVFPMMLIGMQLLALTAVLLSPLRRAWPRWAPLLVLGLASMVFYRSALGRCDLPHVAYSAGMVFLAAGYLLSSILWGVMVSRKGSAVLLAVLCAVNVGLLVPQWQRISWSAVLTSSERLKAYAHQPDDVFFPEKERVVLRRLREVFRDEECIFSLTSEAAWPYLLRKPPCGRFPIAWFASARPVREEFFRDLVQDRPERILFSSPTWPNAINGIPNSVRFPDILSYVEDHYAPEEDVMGWIVYRRK